jgi:hypothetical protein
VDRSGQRLELAGQSIDRRTDRVLVAAHASLQWADAAGRLRP